MKNIFDMDYKNEHWDGDAFKARVLSPELKAEQDALADRRIALILNDPPKLYRRLRLVLLLLCGFFAILGLELLSAAHLAPGTALLSLAGVALIGLVAAWVVGNRLRLSEEEVEAALDLLDGEERELDGRCRKEMNVPEDAVAVDTPSRVYNTYLRNDRAVYANGLCYVFAEDNCLCFFDSEDVFSIPLSDITGIVEVKEPLTMEGWMKDTPYTAAPYNAFDIQVVEGKNIYRLGSYCAVRCTREGEEYQVILPRYDIDVILTLTGLSLTDGNA